MNLVERNGVRIALLDADGPLLASEANALDIIGDAFGTDADVIAIPIERLAPDFLDLKTGLLGGVVQKFTNYQLRVAFVGDISTHVAASIPLRDFIYESNKGRRILFADNLDALAVLLK